MPVAWSIIRPAIAAIVVAATGLAVEWDANKAGYIAPDDQAIVFARVRTTRQIGRDETRMVDLELPKPAATLERTNYGQRVIGLEIRVEAFRHDDDTFAMVAAEQIREAFEEADHAAELLAVNCAVVELGQVQDLGRVMTDDRAVSVAVFELQIAAVADAAPKSLFNIEQAEIDGSYLT